MGKYLTLCQLYILSNNISILGGDRDKTGRHRLSIEEYQKSGRPTHHSLPGAGVIIVKGLDLADVPPGDYELLCLPLKIKDSDVAPARVFLREME